MSLSETVQSGDRRESLVALRDTLATSIEAADPKSVAPLANQLRQVLTELAEMGDGKAASVVDDLRARRARRAAASAG